MTKKNNNFHGWLKTNAWPIIIAILGILGMGVVGLSGIKANAQEIIEIREEMVEYPSKEWFELKFDTIDQSIQDLEEAVEGKVNRE